MLKMVDGTGIIGVDMVCPLGGAVSPPQPPNFDKIEMEGVGSLTLPNSLKAPLERVELIGNSVQGENPAPDNPQEIKSVGRKSKNIFNKNAAKQGYEFGSTASDIETVKQGWFVSDFMPVKATTYLISGKKTGNGCKLYNKDKVFVKNTQAAYGQIKFEEGIAYFRINGEIKDLDNIQVEEGTVATDYEPYSDTCLLDVKVTGKNLIKTSPILLKRWSNNIDNHVIEYVTLKPHTTYTLAMEEDTNYVNDLRVRIFSKNDMTRWLVELLGSGKNKEKFTTKDDAECVLCAYYFLDYKGDVKHLQLVEGDTFTPYEPYQEPQNLTLTSDRPITKWDKLVEQGGSMGWLNSGKIAKEFTFVSKASDENISGRIRRRFKTSLNGKFPQTDKVMCNFLTTDNVRNDYSIGIVGSGDIYIYFYENTGVETLEQANHWLKNLPFEKTIIFERKTTEFIPLSQEEQTQLRNLHSYNGTTNIMVDSGEVECGIKLTYRKEI